MKFQPSVLVKLQLYFHTSNLESVIGSYLSSFRVRHASDFSVPVLPGKMYYDEFGCLWQGTDEDVGQVKGHPLKEPSLKNYIFPDGSDPDRVAGLNESISKYHDNYFYVSIENHTLLERAFNLRGTQEFLMDIYDHPNFVSELLDQILDYDLKLARQLLNFDIDAIRINDDWGDQRGIFIGIDNWRKLIKPRISTLCEFIRSRSNTHIMLHSDGNISDILPDIIDMGIDAIDPTQPEAMDIYALKKKYGRHITFIGGMSTQRTMPFGSPADVREEVQTLVHKLGHDGGYILSPGIIVQKDVPMQNILAFIEICKILNA
jgi:uroporphyrinogen decarboxylase